MTTVESAARADRRATAYKWAYRVFAYFGLMTVFGALLYGFRYDASAPATNYAINVLLYAAFITPHLLMTRSWFKRIAWGDPAGSPRERRVYITLTIVTWGAVLLLQWPLPGWELTASKPVLDGMQFAGTVAFLLFVVLFFEGATPASIDSLLGVPGSTVTHTHGPETPLFTEGAYAQVRHPMYRAAILAGLCSLLVHPNLAQLLWAGMIGATFIGFVPIEEAQLIRARGDDYRRYMQRTPYRIFRGVW